MPWRVKRVLLLILCGLAAVVLALIVIVQGRSHEGRLLAIGLLVGAAAMIVVALPDDRQP